MEKTVSSAWLVFNNKKWRDETTNLKKKMEFLFVETKISKVYRFFYWFLRLVFNWWLAWYHVCLYMCVYINYVRNPTLFPFSSFFWRQTASPSLAHNVGKRNEDLTRLRLLIEVIMSYHERMNDEAARHHHHFSESRKSGRRLDDLGNIYQPDPHNYSWFMR